MSVAITSGLLDLSAQKFGMDGLGLPTEKVTIRVLVASREGKRVTVFGTYPIGGRHAQISSQRLLDMGSEVEVLSIERYSAKSVVEDFNRLVEQGPWRGKVALRWEVGRVTLVVGGESLPARIEEMYVAAAKLWATVLCQGKTLRLAIGDELEIFDKSRRRLNGFKMKGDKLMLKRRFQNPDWAPTPGR
jgi:hypothetical protein